jgi:hypothetical protein
VLLCIIHIEDCAIIFNKKGNTLVVECDEKGVAGALSIQVAEPRIRAGGVEHGESAAIETVAQHAYLNSF